jgi:hypothetical protein
LFTAIELGAQRLSTGSQGFFPKVVHSIWTVKAAIIHRFLGGFSYSLFTTIQP